MPRLAASSCRPLLPSLLVLLLAARTTSAFLRPATVLPSPRSTAASPLRMSYSAPEPLANDPPFRIGHGFDIHRLEPGLPLVIGGVKIDYEKGSAAHSDGDALYHSVTDAILGAIGMPDIGQLFPGTSGWLVDGMCSASNSSTHPPTHPHSADNDPKWKGANSAQFMKEAHRLMTLRGYKIGNVDVTLILQKPKVKDIKPQMKVRSGWVGGWVDWLVTSLSVVFETCLLIHPPTYLRYR